VGGIILNRRNVPEEEERVRAFATDRDIQIVADIPRSDLINRAEDLGKTVIEKFPDADISAKFMDLARRLLAGKQ